MLKDLVKEVQIARGRLYFWRRPDDLMARITPLGGRKMLLEAPRRAGWTNEGEGTLPALLRTLEGDKEGTFHGLGSLVAKTEGGEPTVQQRLHREFGVPFDVLAEPRYWYSMHRTPKIFEADAERKRVLVRFEAFSDSGSFHGTALYAHVEGNWGCFTIKPAAESIATAEAWLVKREWQGWG